ncbi:MAG: MBL fold metallo-hydrolase [Solobacterium sp.]|nr:MBL fold metallo-hydrolase [Solobacterium sp.]
MDAEVAFSFVHYTKITSMEGFYAFDFAAHMRRQGVFYSCDENMIVIKEEGHTLRAFLQRYIEKTFADENKVFLRRLLLNISSKEYADSFLFQQGFSAVGFLLLCESLLRFFFREGKEKKLSFLLALVLCLFYHAPFSLLQHTMIRFLRLLSLKRREQVIITVMVVLLIRPQDAVTAAFLIPFLFRISSLTENVSSWLRMSILMLYQSFTYQKMNLLDSMLFPFFIRISGFCYLLALFQLCIPGLDLHGLFQALDHLLFLKEQGTMYGSCMGIGMIAYLLLLIGNGIQPKKQLRIFLLTVLFQLTGLFHPCAEISFINVGQGDSILIREPFGQMNMLVDTGKPQMQERLYSFLHGKGIRHLSTLLITHADDDHSGNQEAVTNDFAPDQIITEHQESFRSGRMQFYDLNQIRNEDENQSSIVLYFRLNGLDIILPADADQVTEESIVHQYGDLSCDILKLSHHGSESGSCDTFLNALKPDLAIISSGAFSIYHHPSPETIRRLERRHIPWLDMKDEGDITILCLPMVNLLVTSHGKIAIMIP